jgi:branched-chain amino acid transport system permease protein
VTSADPPGQAVEAGVDHYRDVQLLPDRAAWIRAGVLVAVLAALPLVVPGYRIFTLNYMAIFVIVGLGMNLLVGDTGLVSLGHAGFLAIGAYTTVLLMTELSVPFVAALPLAGAVSAVFGFLLGLPALRLAGPYLAIATLGFGLAVTLIIGHSAFFGGHMGLVVGRAWRAIRDSEIAAATMGVDIAWYKTLSFAVSAAYAGIAGGLLAAMTGFISPGVFTFTLSLMFLAMVVIGGLGSIPGAVLGSLLMGYLNLEMDSFQELPILGPALETFSERVMSVSGLPNFGWVVTGTLIVTAILVEPRGLHGVWLRLAGLYGRVSSSGSARTG